MSHLVYFHHKPCGEIFYVGQSNSGRRPKSKFGRNAFWHNVVSKYGYYVNIVHKDLTKEQANMLEVHYIKDIGRRELKTGTLVNKTDGADLGSNIIFSKETREKMSQSHKGKKSPHSEDTKKKMSLARIGKPLTANFMAASLKANIGRLKKPHEIEILRASKLGKPRPDWVRQKVSKTHLERHATHVIATKDMSIYEFASMKEASETLNRDRASIRRAAIENGYCNGYRIYL